MSDYDADRSALARCEEDYLREPAWRTGEECGEPTRDGAALCEECAPADDDGLVSVDGSEGE